VTDVLVLDIDLRSSIAALQLTSNAQLRYGWGFVLNTAPQSGGRKHQLGDEMEGSMRYVMCISIALPSRFVSPTRPKLRWPFIGLS